MKKLILLIALSTLIFSDISFAHTTEQRQKLKSFSFGMKNKDGDYYLFPKSQCEKFLFNMKENSKKSGAVARGKYENSYKAFFIANCDEMVGLEKEKDFRRVIRGYDKYSGIEAETEEEKEKFDFSTKECEMFLQILVDSAKKNSLSRRYEATYDAYYAGDCQDVLDLKEKDFRRVIRGSIKYPLIK